MTGKYPGGRNYLIFEKRGQQMFELNKFLRLLKSSHNRNNIKRLVMGYGLSLALLIAGSDAIYPVNLNAKAANNELLEEAMILTTEDIQSIAEDIKTIELDELIMNLEDVITDATQHGEDEVAADSTVEFDKLYLQTYKGQYSNMFHETMEELEDARIEKERDDKIEEARLEAREAARLRAEARKEARRKAKAEAARLEKKRLEEEALEAARLEKERKAKEEKAREQRAVKTINTSMNFGKISQNELEILERIVEAEATGEDLTGRILVANVVLNRVNHGSFPNSIEGVVFQRRGSRYQFSPIRDQRYYKVTVSDSTRSAVQKALAGEDYSKGALYFVARPHANRSNLKWFDNNLQRLFQHGCHEFYK